MQSWEIKHLSTAKDVLEKEVPLEAGFLRRCKSIDGSWAAEKQCRSSYVLVRRTQTLQASRHPL